MATVVERGPDRRWEQLGLALGALGGQFVVEQKESARKQAAAATLQRLSKGELDPIQTVGELTANGMKPEDADRLVGNVFRAKEVQLLERKTDADISQTDRKIDLDAELGRGGLANQSRGLDIEQDLGNKRIQLGRDELVSVERRANAQIAAQERITGMQIDASRRDAIFRAETERELENLRQRGRQNEIKLTGAVESYLGQEKLGIELFKDRQDKEFQAGENAKDRETQLGIAKAGSAAKATEGEVRRQARAAELTSAIARIPGLKPEQLTPEKLARLPEVAASYDADSGDILRDMAQTLGVNTKVVTPDGMIATTVDGKAVGGIEQLTLNLARTKLTDAYAKEALADQPNYNRGAVTTSVLKEADSEVFTPEKILPPEAINPQTGNIKGPIAARYLATTHNFTKNDLRRWFKRTTPGITANDLDTLLNAAEE